MHNDNNNNIMIPREGDSETSLEDLAKLRGIKPRQQEDQQQQAGGGGGRALSLRRIGGSSRRRSSPTTRIVRFSSDGDDDEKGGEALEQQGSGEPSSSVGRRQGSESEPASSSATTDRKNSEVEGSATGNTTETSSILVPAAVHEQIRVNVKYFNDDGRRKALSLSTCIHQDFHVLNKTVTISIPRHRREELKDDPNIFYVGHDGTQEQWGRRGSVTKGYVQTYFMKD